MIIYTLQLKRKAGTSVSAPSSSQTDTCDQEDDQDESRHSQYDPHPEVDDGGAVCGRHSSCKRKALS